MFSTLAFMIHEEVKRLSTLFLKSNHPQVKRGPTLMSHLKFSKLCLDVSLTLTRFEEPLSEHHSFITKQRSTTLDLS